MDRSPRMIVVIEKNIRHFAMLLRCTRTGDELESNIVVLKSDLGNIYEL
jgi:hypothetical protein